MSTRHIVPAVVIVLAVTCSGIAQQPTTSNPIVLTVNDEQIRAAEVGAAAQGIAASAAQSGMEVPQEQILQMATSQVVDATLLAQEAKKTGIKVEAGQIESALEGIEKGAGGPDGLAAALEEIGMTLDQLRKSMQKTMLARAYVDTNIRPKVSVSDADLEAFYQQNQEMFAAPEQVKARHILIKAELDAPEDKAAAARARAEAARERAIGGEDFATLAEELSEGPSAPRGGDLGWIARDQMVEPFATVAFSLEPGSISDVVKTRYGFHVILVEDHREASTRPLDEVQEELKAALEERAIAEKADEALKGLRENAKIESAGPSQG